MSIAGQTQIQPDRRSEHRQRVLKGASVLQTINDSEIKVTIRNMHAGGAELKVPLGVQLPEEFLLYIPIDAVAYRSAIRWHHGERVGVQFLRREPKPHWHYG